VLFSQVDIELKKFEDMAKRESRPIQLKIGVDVGVTLCRLAAHNLSSIFVGVEIKQEKAQIAFKRATALKLKNVWVVNSEAQDFISKHCPRDCFDVVHVYFPTPYPEALKQLGLDVSNLLITSEFMTEVHRTLKIGGALRIVTDVETYFRSIERYTDLSRWLHVEWRHLEIEKPSECLVGTPTEKHCRREGRAIFSMQLLKI
jgi:tRNA G46 methylase TrmB